MGPDRTPLASVEAVREELRKLGYLDSGLDRFVLGGAGGPSRLRASLGVALRVGLAGGALGGAALSLAAVGLDSRLLREPRDLAVLTLYLVLLAGTATGAAAIAGGLAAAWAGRRGRIPGPNLSRDAGLATSVPGLLYLALWWRSHWAGVPPAMQALALALGLALVFVLGRFGALAAVAVLAAGGARGWLPEASLMRRRMLPLLASAALLFCGGVAAASYLAEAPAEAPDFTVVPTGLRVRVLGIDGLEARMAAQMIEGGEMPRLRVLLSQGARARLRAEPERVPAIVWTTIATGRGPEAHGIRSASARRLAGMRTPVPAGEGPFASALGAATDLLRITRHQPPTAVLRGVKAFWNVASEKGLRVGAVNCWATWPADTVNGYVVTDRAYFKLEKGGPQDREVYPPEAFDRLKALATTGGGSGTESGSGAEASSGAEGGSGGEGGSLAASGRSADRARVVRTSAAARLDRFHLTAARLLRDAAPPDIEATYLSGLDIVAMQQLGDASALDVATLDARLNAVRSYYRVVDDFIKDMDADRGPADVLVLVGDPGRLARRAAPEAEGILLLVGGPARPCDLGVASERDVAPTVLHLSGLPVSRELDGRALESALSTDFRREHPVRFVASYGRRPAARRAESAFDRQMVEELRSLGYIQ